MSKIEIQILDYTNNVLGTLDITDSQNFPLVLSYLVSDSRNIETKFGDFTKSFDVPATKSNNKLFNNIYNAQIVDNKSIIEFKDCRILVDTQEFFRGKVKVKGSKQSSKPLSYNCTIFGGNYGWMSKIKGLYLCDLYSQSETFIYNRTNIENSWTSNQSNSEILFPLINYGEWSSAQGSVNLDSNRPNLNLADMRPSFWIYNLINKIFNNVGYSLESEFINHADFKKLITHFNPTLSNTALPDPVSLTRLNWNQNSSQLNLAIFDSALTSVNYQAVTGSTTYGVADGNGVSSGFHTLKFNEVLQDPATTYNPSTGDFTSQSDGLYNIENTSHILIGNYLNDQSSDGFEGCKIKAALKIVRINLSGTQTVLFQTSDENAKVGSYNFKNYVGKTAGVNYPVAGQTGSFPPLNCVKISSTANDVFLKTGEKLRIQVNVNVVSENTNTDVKWGIVNLQDKNRKSFEGSTQIRFPSITNYGFYNTNNVDNVNNIWEDDEVPFVKISKSSTNYMDYQFDTTYKIKDLLPCDMGQLEFLRGVGHLFNLQFQTDSKTNKVFIEPYDDFYKDKTLAYDWTQKLDLTKEIEDKYEIGLSQEISFEYKKDDADGLMTYINGSFRDFDTPYHFYNYYEDLGDKFPKGLTKFVNPIFSSTWTDFDPSVVGSSPAVPPTFGLTGTLVPIINKEQSLYGDNLIITASAVERPEKIKKYNPRILYYYGYAENPNNSNLETHWSRHIETLPFPLIARSKTYPRATFVDWEDISTSTKFDNLSFDDEIISPPNDSSAPVIKLGLYNTYYKKMIDQLKANPRIRVMHFNLKKSDMINLDLSRLIYVDGTYWRINKIVDYSPIKNITTKVECVQWIEKS